MRTRVATSVLAVLLLLGAAAPVWSGASYHFAVLSDRTGGHTEGVYPRVIEEIARLNPDFVVTVGDQIEGYTDDDQLANAQWDTIESFLGRLDCPVYLTAGNHDIWSDESEQIYRERTGFDPFYSFDHSGTHFVVLDNSRLESWEDDPEQLEWLDTDLAAAAGAERVFIFAHKPLWTQTLALGEDDPLHEILTAHDVDIHFTGHLHHYFSAEYDGVRYVSMGSSGGGVLGSDRSPARGQFFQFGWVTVDDAEHELAIVELGAIHDPDVSTIAVQKEIRLAEGELIRVHPIVLEHGDSVDGDIVVVVENRSPETLRSAVEWSTPDGWSIDPLSAPVSVEPGQVEEVVFRGISREPLFPVPTFSLEYPLSDGRTIRAGGAPRVVRVAEAGELGSAPVIDGRVVERCWSDAGVEDSFYSENGAPGVEGATEFLFGYDDSNIYLAAVCHDPGVDDLVADVQERDGPVYGEDCVGFFIQPDMDEMAVYQVYVNPAGTVFDQRITFDETMWYTTHVDWNGGIEASGDVGEDRWTAEIRIPFEVIGLDAPPQGSVGLNFRRKQPDGWPPADWQVPIDYDPHTFGRLRFVRD
ncbi:MAG: hypothetical protein GF405_10775 [Candidatus Eisenbacteria bacterium]|nr:hypothetical protein [Candidatus Eisenbacteria bacterium]